MSDFPIAVDWLFVLECIIKIFASVVCGFILGLERKTRNQAVGTRTLILIAVSSALLSILSYYMAEQGNRRGYSGGDPTRIVAGVVSGIGFVGGGAIIKQGLNIKGLTSAAIIWTSSALGLAIGDGLYIQAALVLIVAMISLVVLEKVEEKFFPAGKNKTLHLVYENEAVNIGQVKKILEDSGMIVSDINMSQVLSTRQTILRFLVKTPQEEDLPLLIDRLKVSGTLTEFSITD